MKNVACFRKTVYRYATKKLNPCPLPATGNGRWFYLAAVHLVACVAALLSGAPRLHAGQLVSGPMLGYQAHREALIWVEVKDASNVLLQYQLAGRPETRKNVLKEITASSKTPYNTQVITFAPGPLEMGATYEYALYLDGQIQLFSYPLEFTTKALWEWRTPPPDFTFATGSCAYFNDAPYDRPGEPYGKGTEIFSHIAAAGTDFMLWLGDNWYYREPDYSSVNGLWYRASKSRSTPELQPLLAAMNHYAIWDDHDYGPNNSNRSYPLKETTLQIFKTYWGNSAYGESDNPGIYTTFLHADAQFFLLDNRYNRDANERMESEFPAKGQLGRKQVEWLKNALLESHSTFKFIALGGQFINPLNKYESYMKYSRERKEILDFIARYNVEGVVFLSGDRHHTELLKLNRQHNYSLYELTSSPLTSGAHTSITETIEYDNPMRIPGTLVTTQNYCTLSITGPRNKRILTIRCYDRNNELVWTHEIDAQAELHLPEGVTPDYRGENTATTATSD